MTKILVYGPTEFENLGTVSALMGVIKCLRSYMPDVQITLLSPQVAKHREFEEKLGIELRQHPWMRVGRRARDILAKAAILIAFNLCRCFFYRLAGRFNRSIKSPYEQYDVVIHNNADTFIGRDFGWIASWLSLTISFSTMFAGWAVFGRPTATIPTDMGPFTTRLTKWLARFVLNRIDVLALREEVSYDYCQQLGLSKPRICLTADPGFLLEPIPQEKVGLILQQEDITKGDKPFIGFSPSSLEMQSLAFSKSMSREARQRKYVELMAAMIDHVVSRLDATVCFIPHVIGGSMSSIEQNDDREVCYQIYEQVKNKQAVGILRGRYLPDELMGVIGTCDMFIGCRMHSTIAATSQGIPTVTIAYGEKFYRVIGKTMRQEEYIVDIRNPSFDELLAELELKLDSLWENRDKVKEELKERMELVQQQAMLYGKLIKELVESLKKAST